VRDRRTPCAPTRIAVPSRSDEEASRDPALGSFVSETLGFRPGADVLFGSRTLGFCLLQSSAASRH
jgi:hypothetical protein